MADNKLTYKLAYKNLQITSTKAKKVFGRWKLVASRISRTIRDGCPTEESIHFSCALLGWTAAAGFFRYANEFPMSFQK